MPVRKYDISQVGTGLTFLFKLSKSLHLFSHFNLPAKQHGEPWTSTPTPAQIPHDERPHFSHFICSTIFRAATYVSPKSDRYIFFIILNLICVWDWVQQKQENLVSFSKLVMNKTVADDTNILITYAWLLGKISIIDRN